jgi:hypothetical protein
MFCVIIYYIPINIFGGRRGRDRMVVYLQLPVQSVPITTNIVNLNPTHGEVYSIQHYVIKVCQ